MPAPANLLFFLSDNHNRALAGCSLPRTPSGSGHTGPLEFAQAAL